MCSQVDEKVFKDKRLGGQGRILAEESFVRHFDVLHGHDKG